MVQARFEWLELGSTFSDSSINEYGQALRNRLAELSELEPEPLSDVRFCGGGFSIVRLSPTAVLRVAAFQSIGSTAIPRSPPIRTSLRNIRRRLSVVQQTGAGPGI